MLNTVEAREMPCRVATVVAALVLSRQPDPDSFTIRIVIATAVERLRDRFDLGEPYRSRELDSRTINDLAGTSGAARPSLPDGQSGLLYLWCGACRRSTVKTVLVSTLTARQRPCRSPRPLLPGGLRRCGG